MYLAWSLLSSRSKLRHAETRVTRADTAGLAAREKRKARRAAGKVAATAPASKALSAPASAPYSPLPDGRELGSNLGAPRAGDAVEARKLSEEL